MNETGVQTDRKSIQKRIELLQRESELVQKEVRLQNLVLFGLAEKPEETAVQLKRAVTEILVATCKRLIIFDTVYRLGLHPHGELSSRPVRIRFMSIGARNFAFGMRSNLAAGLSLKEDLPFTLRRDYCLLRKKRAELSGSGIKNVIDWKEKTIYAENGKNYGVLNGKLVDVFDGDNFSSSD